MMGYQEFRNSLKGIIPVQYCPYNEKYLLDVEGLKKNTEFLVNFAKEDKDVSIMTNGSTTECYANSIEEQKAVIKTVVDTVDGACPVIAGVSQPGTMETIKLAKYAREVRADCVMVVNPYYHCPTKEGLYRHFRAVAEAVPDMAVLIYNNIDVSGLKIDPILMQRLSKIENIVGCKDNTPLASEFMYKSVLISPEDMVFVHGGPISYPAAAAYGFRYKGFVTFIGNFAPSLVYDIYEAVEKDRDFDKALEKMKKILPIFDFMAKCMKARETPSIIPEAYRNTYMYMRVGKAALDLVGLSGGPLRPPLEDLTDEEKREFKNILEKMDVI